MTPATTIVRLHPDGATDAEAATDQVVAKTLRAAGYQTWYLGQAHRSAGRSAYREDGYDVVVRCTWWQPSTGPDAPLTGHLIDEVIGVIENSADQPVLITVVGCARHLPLDDVDLAVARIRHALDRVHRSEASVEVLTSASLSAVEDRTMAG